MAQFFKCFNLKIRKYLYIFNVGTLEQTETSMNQPTGNP